MEGGGEDCAEDCVEDYAEDCAEDCVESRAGGGGKDCAEDCVESRAGRCADVFAGLRCDASIKSPGEPADIERDMALFPAESQGEKSRDRNAHAPSGGDYVL